MYRHYFRCGECKKHVVSLTEGATPWQPAKTHGDALEAGAIPAQQQGNVKSFIFHL